MKHYDREAIERCMAGELGIFKRCSVQRHLKKCPACARLSEEIKNENELLVSLRAAQKRYRNFEKDKDASAVLSSLVSRFGAPGGTGRGSD